ncbi:hypothetical protein KEHDKFFH_05000 [Marinobacter maroccanus]|uniref:Uncharacterized protein n=1 Tax=Marinobacter maroccanus TaxID=2055143 RepID=A0A2S5ZCK6_9GAMM|nr:hypothetical protein [Marinobacter maroccanus]PPI85119.1 hypothetical protein KEHDKFFH_05000 [Marinobacter maroccanus]
MASLISGCAVTDQASIEFRTSNNLAFEINQDRFDTVDIQPSETKIWRGSELVGSVATMETNADFSTAVEEVRHGFREAKKSFGDVIKLKLGEGVYGFSATVNDYTTAFIATSNHPSSWVTISADDDVFYEVLSTLTVRERHR